MKEPSAQPQDGHDVGNRVLTLRHSVALFLSSALDRKLLADFLLSLGHDVAVFEPATDPSAAAPATSLIVVDERAAARMGANVFQLRWRSNLAFLPILILLSPRANAARWIKAGFDDVLRQPISKEELKARLDVFLRFRAQSEQYRNLFQNALIGIYRCDAHGRLLMANPAFVTRLGFDAFEGVAAGGLEQWRIRPTQAEFTALVVERNAVVGMETVWRRRDGSTLFALENVRTVREDGRLLYLEGSIEDISERKQAELEREQLLGRAEAARAEAEAASRLKDQFLATVSHELRTPLTAIIGWATLLRSGRVHPSVMPSAYEVIERQARTQAQVVEDLLDVSRIITGKLRLDLRTVDVGATVAAGIEAVQPAADAKGVRIIRNDAIACGSSIVGDAARLQQVVWNLLSNAVKFTPRGGEIAVGLESDDNGLRIVVADNGEGIDPDFLPFVFDRFRQHDSTTTRQHAGLGLGLAIVRHLVELHGGTVEAHSAGKGRGATFVVKLPALALRAVAPSQACAQPDRALPEEAPRENALTGMRVLLVDDDKDALRVFRAVLADAGAEVVEARNAQDARQVLESIRVDLLVSDISMPGTDGYDFIRDARTRLGIRIPAIAVTAAASPADRALALGAGYDRHIAKPVTPATLISSIVELIGSQPPKTGTSSSEISGTQGSPA